MATATTRRSVTCPIFGAGKDLNLQCFPTCEDVMQYYHHVRTELRSSKKEPPFKDIAAVVTERLEYLWKLASIPTVSTARINQMLKSYRDKMANIIKSLNAKKKNESLQKNLEAFKKSTKTTLFDISACKCPDLTKCSCPCERRVPLKEQQFLLDQRSDRKMAIGTLDVETTNKNEMTLARRLAILKQEGIAEHQEPSTSKRQETSREQPSSSASSETEDTSIESSSSYELTPREKHDMKEKTRMKLQRLLKVNMVDSSNYSVEERLVASAWVHERNNTRKTLEELRSDFCERFGKEAPHKRTFLKWERKLFETGSIKDKPRTGRPSTRNQRVSLLEESIEKSPQKSTRKRSAELQIPRSTMRTDLKILQYQPQHVQELSNC